MALDFKFFTFLEKEAKIRRDSAGYNGEMGDRGAQELLTQVSVYTAGGKGELPQVWKTLYKKYLKESDPEYQNFLRLKEKFE